MGQNIKQRKLGEVKNQAVCALVLLTGTYVLEKGLMSHCREFFVKLNIP